VLAKGEVAMARLSVELRDDPELVSSYLGGHVGEPEPEELVSELHEVQEAAEHRAAATVGHGAPTPEQPAPVARTS
jgi:hypothetical protein